MGRSINGLAEVLGGLADQLRREIEREPSLNDLLEALGECVALAYILQVKQPERVEGMTLALETAADSAKRFHMRFFGS